MGPNASGAKPGAFSSVRKFRSRRKREFDAFRERRAALIRRLGSCCMTCGCPAPGLLELAHKAGDDKPWSGHTLDRMELIAKYEQEADLGYMTLSCVFCHYRIPIDYQIPWEQQTIDCSWCGNESYVLTAVRGPGRMILCCSDCRKPEGCTCWTKNWGGCHNGPKNGVTAHPEPVTTSPNSETQKSGFDVGVWI